MGPLQVAFIRGLLRSLPAPLRERLAVRLFLLRQRHAEPERERAWRARGTAVKLAACEAVAFGPAAGPAAILVHGWAGRGLQLCAFIEPLVAAGYRVYALDAPGHGRTAHGAPGLASLAAALETAAQEMDPAVIVAHSMGAAAAIVAAARTGFTGRLLCLGGPPETAQVFARVRGFMGLPDSGHELFLHHLRRRVEGLRFDDLADIAACARVMPGSLMAILAAGDDDVPVDESVAIVEAGGGAAVVLADAGHRNVMWHPAAVRQGVAFLTGAPVDPALHAPPCS